MPPTHRSVKSRLVAITAGSLFALAGCGGGDTSANDDASPSEPQTSALSKDDFLAQTNEICRESDALIDQDELDRLAADEDLAGLQSYCGDVVGAAYEQRAAELETLGAPTGDEAAVAAVVDSARAYGAQLVVLSQATPDTFADEATEVGALAEEMSTAATDYGLTDCGA